MFYCQNKFVFFQKTDIRHNHIVNLMYVVSYCINLALGFRFAVC